MEEFSLNKPPATLRILFLGDSFVAGYRVDQKKTLAYLLAQRLSKRCRSRVEVMVAEVEDPVIATYYLQKYGTSFSPDLILYGFCLGNDISESFFRLYPGYQFLVSESSKGEPPFLELYPQPQTEQITRKFFAEEIPRSCRETERIRQMTLLANSNFSSFPLQSVQFIWSKINTEIPHWQPQFIPGDTPKLFDWATGLGYFLKEPHPLIQEAYQSTAKALSYLKVHAQKSSADFALFIFPQKFQLSQKNWEATVWYYGLKREAFDLDLPNRRLAQITEDLDIVLLDPTNKLKILNGKGRELYIRGDMHWNSKGHRVVLDALFESICDLPSVKKILVCRFLK